MMKLEEVESVDQILDLSNDGSAFVATSSEGRKEIRRKVSVSSAPLPSTSGVASSSTTESAKYRSSSAARKLLAYELLATGAKCKEDLRVGVFVLPNDLEVLSPNNQTLYHGVYNFSRTLANGLPMWEKADRCTVVFEPGQ